MSSPIQRCARCSTSLASPPKLRALPEASEARGVHKRDPAANREDPCGCPSFCTPRATTGLHKGSILRCQARRQRPRGEGAVCPRRAAWPTPRVWSGAVLVDGEIVGTSRGARVDVTVESWRPLSCAEIGRAHV